MKIELSWNNATVEEMKQLSAIYHILAKNPKLLVFLFDPKTPTLKNSPDNLLKQANAFSTGELFLVKICLDVWNSSGNAQLSELLYQVDRERFDNILIGLSLVGPKHIPGYLQNIFEG